MQNITDYPATTVTASWNSGRIFNSPESIGAYISITSVSGTTPTLDLSLDESQDGWQTWKSVYQFPRATAATTLTLERTPINGVRRWSWVVTGTTPSFTIDIKVNAFDTSWTSIPRSFFDRTIVANTLNSTTPAYDIEGCKSISAIVSSGAATTPGVFTLQLSPDGTNWATGWSVITSVASVNVLGVVTSWAIAKFARLIVSTAWTAQTLNYVHIYWN